MTETKKVSSGLTRYEQETVISCNAEEEMASVYTCDPVWLRKMNALVKKDPRIIVDEDAQPTHETCRTYIMPKKQVGVRATVLLSIEKRKKRTLQARLNMQKLQAKRKTQSV